MPEISVVIPLYNKAGYVKRAVNSILCQTFQNFEIMVVNDGSTDGSEKVVEEYKDSRIKLLHRDNPSPGGHAARNTGIRNATSDFVTFLDADDEWKPEFLETVLRLKEKYPSAGAYATAYKEKKMDGSIKVPRFWFVPEEGIIPDYFRSSLYGASPICTGAVAVPRYVFETVGFFPEGVRRGGDLDMWARIALKYPIAFSRYVGATYYKDVPGSVIKTNVMLEGYRIVNTLEEFLKNNRDIPAERKRYIAEYANKFRLSSAAHCIKAGKMEQARAHLKKCRTRRFFIRKLWLQLHCLLKSRE